MDRLNKGALANVRLFDREKVPEMYDKIQSLGKELNKLGWGGQVNIHKDGTATAFFYPKRNESKLIAIANKYYSIDRYAYSKCYNQNGLFYEVTGNSAVEVATKALDFVNHLLPQVCASNNGANNG